MAELPYYPDVAEAPQNSMIGGASLWVMGGKKPEEYKGVAEFFTFLLRRFHFRQPSPSPALKPGGRAAQHTARLTSRSSWGTPS
jgi:hypothetical protein